MVFVSTIVFVGAAVAAITLWLGAAEVAIARMADGWLWLAAVGAGR
jgi:hypothetical protein